jgi:hypothetical protein
VHIEETPLSSQVAEVVAPADGAKRIAAAAAPARKTGARILVAMIVVLSSWAVKPSPAVLVSVLSPDELSLGRAPGGVTRFMPKTYF